MSQVQYIIKVPSIPFPLEVHALSRVSEFWSFRFATGSDGEFESRDRRSIGDDDAVEAPNGSPWFDAQHQAGDRQLIKPQLVLKVTMASWMVAEHTLPSSSA